MNTTFDNKDKKIIAPAFDTSSLSLAEFNRIHGESVRRNAEASKTYRKAQVVNRAFDYAIVTMMLVTAAGCATGLLTILAH